MKKKHLKPGAYVLIAAVLVLTVFSLFRLLSTNQNTASAEEQNIEIDFSENSAPLTSESQLDEQSENVSVEPSGQTSEEQGESLIEEQPDFTPLETEEEVEIIIEEEGAAVAGD